MPELPDVETFRRYVNATALHQRIAGVQVREKRVLDGVTARRLQHAFKDRRFEATDRRGKYLFIHTDGEAVLVLHFGMTGSLEYEKEREPDEHDCVLFDFEGGYRLAYICQRLLGKVTLTESVERFTRKNQLGPDALDVSQDEFAAILESSKTPVKSCLMDQKRIAGVGNIYSDEILFQSRVSPRHRSNMLEKNQQKRLYRQMHRVLTMAIERQADPSKLPSSWLLPHREKGESCPRCRGEVARGKVGGRSAYWCPRCQGE